MELILKNNKCNGCHACYNICSLNCIKMIEDEDGFLYPEIESSKCMDCGKCREVCPVLNNSFRQKGKAYACINKDDEIRKESSSGGIFTLLAEYIIDSGGVVFGAAFDENFNVKHIFVDNKSELSKLRGSKYVQSIIGDAYKYVKEFLKEERNVLFTGTPCQVDGLIKYLGKTYSNLYIQDIICHGVPSPKVFKKYIGFRENRANTSVRKIYFRDKLYGWKNYSNKYVFSNDKEYVSKYEKDLFMKSFLKNLCLRPSCYDCHSKSLERVSDITLADFWGIENILPEMFDDRGTSLVFVNSKKGEELFDRVSSKMIYAYVDINEAVKYNTSAYESVALPSNRKKFMRLIDKVDFDRAVNKSLKQSILYKVLRKIKCILIGVYRYVQK